MFYLIPIFAAYLTYLYNYRSILRIKKDIVILEKMNENDKWIIGKFDDVTRQIGKLTERIKSVETTQRIYFGGYSLISIIIFLLNYYKK